MIPAIRNHRFPHGQYGLAIALSISLGCGASRNDPPVGTGARETAETFFTEIAEQKWADSFAKLDGDSRKNLTLAAFTSRAEKYRNNLGFELAKVRIRLCEEQGDKANAHVVLSDGSDSPRKSYRDAVLLHKSAAGWGVVLPQSFGSKR